MMMTITMWRRSTKLMSLWSLVFGLWSEVQPTRKRKRESAHAKYISYNKVSKKYQVSVTKDGKLQTVGTFPTQEEAVVARDPS
jgi:hypothetical protein